MSPVVFPLHLHDKMMIDDSSKDGVVTVTGFLIPCNHGKKKSNGLGVQHFDNILKYYQTR
jgi:hypothetical protein